jgi:hypothetical protein
MSSTTYFNYPRYYRTLNLLELMEITEAPRPLPSSWRGFIRGGMKKRMEHRTPVGRYSCLPDRSSFDWATTSYDPNHNYSLRNILQRCIVSCSDDDATIRREGVLLAIENFCKAYAPVYAACQRGAQGDITHDMTVALSTAFKNIARKANISAMSLWSRIQDALVNASSNCMRRGSGRIVLEAISVHTALLGGIIQPCRCCNGLRKTEKVKQYNLVYQQVYVEGMTHDEAQERISNDPDVDVEDLREETQVYLREGLAANLTENQYTPVCKKCLDYGRTGNVPVSIRLHRPSYLLSTRGSTETFSRWIHTMGTEVVITNSEMRPELADSIIHTVSQFHQFTRRYFDSSIRPACLIRSYGTVNVRCLDTNDDKWRAGLELEVHSPCRNKLTRLIHNTFPETQVSMVHDGSLSYEEGVEILTGWGSIVTLEGLLNKLSDHLQVTSTRKSPDCCGLHVNLSCLNANRMSTYAKAKMVQFWNDPLNSGVIMAIAGRYNGRYYAVKSAKGTPDWTKTVMQNHRSLYFDADHSDIVNVENSERIEVRAFRSDTDPVVVLGRTAFSMLTAMYTTVGNRGPDSINMGNFYKWFTRRRKDCRVKNAFTNFVTSRLHATPESVLSLPKLSNVR